MSLLPSHIAMFFGCYKPFSHSLDHQSVRFYNGWNGQLKDTKRRLATRRPISVPKISLRR
ncbi:hypothetical protein X975_04569, partial [Stegodyphus mimosarum]